MSSIGGFGSGKAGGGGGNISTSELLSLVYEAQSATDPLDPFNFNQFSKQQLDNLRQAVLERENHLSEQDKEAIEKGEPEQLKNQLKKIREQHLERTRTQQTMRNHATDGTAPQHSAAPQSVAAKHLPGVEHHQMSSAEVLHLIYQAMGDAHGHALDPHTDFATQLRSLQKTLQSLSITLTPEDIEGIQAGEPDRIRRLLQRLAQGRKGPAPADRATLGGPPDATGFARLRASPPLADPSLLAQIKQSLLKLVADPTRRDLFKNGLPVAGRSGEANRLPLLQFMPPRFHKLLQKLGINTLADFLARATPTEGRAMLGKALGLSTPALHLATLRAELMDLPVQPLRGKQPHLKDLLLLAKLGVGNREALAKLNGLFERSPAHLEALATLVSRMQRQRPDLVGRARIAAQDLKVWASAAKKRGSDVEVATVRPAKHNEAEWAAENILAWYLRDRAAHPERLFDEMVTRLLLLLGVGGSADDELWRQLTAACGEERLAYYRRLAAHEQLSNELEEIDEEMQRYAEYVLEDNDPSLFYELHPWQRPDTERHDRLICFWMDPVPDYRHVVGPAGSFSDEGKSGALPETLNPVYVCIDPVSGVIVPSGT